MSSGAVDHFGLVGQVLDGQFRVDGVLGEGGFSVVYKGLHLGLSEPIAIKCLKLPGALGSALVESFVRRFRDESRIHYRLSQGNLHIVRSMASGTTMAPATSALVPYMVLEWLDGKSLAAELAERRAEGLHGRPLAETLRVLDPAVDAIAYAHAQGVVHRDLNPGNFFLTKTREGTKLKVLDFGVAKIVSDHSLDLGPRSQTLGQIRIFSPAYGAPEQFDEKVGVVGPWTDVYALSLVALELMTDRQVVDGEHIGELAMKTLDPTNRPSPRAAGVAVGDEVEALFRRSLSLNPAERPQDAGEFWGMLKNAIRKDLDAGTPPRAEVSAVRQRPSFPGAPATLLVGSVSPAVERLRASSAPPPNDLSRAPQKATVRMSNAPPIPGSLAAPPVPTFDPAPPPPPVRLTPAPLSPEPSVSRPNANMTPGAGGVWMRGGQPPSNPPPAPLAGPAPLSIGKIVLLAFGVVVLGALLGTLAWWVGFRR